MSRRSRSYRDLNQAIGLTEGIIAILLVLALIAAFVVVTLVVFVVWTFVRYHQQKSLWIALGACVAFAVAGVALYKLFSLGVFLVLLPAGIAVLRNHVLGCVAEEKRHAHA